MHCYYILWDIDDDDFMHYLTRKELCKEAYNYLRIKKILIPNWWLAL